MSYYMEHEELQEAGLPPETPIWDAQEDSPFGESVGAEDQSGAGMAEDSAAPPGSESEAAGPAGDIDASVAEDEAAVAGDAPGTEEPVQEKPKRKRAPRKKAEQSPSEETDPGQEQGPGDTFALVPDGIPADGKPMQSPDDAEQGAEGDGPDHETAAFLLEDSGEGDALHATQDTKGAESETLQADTSPAGPVETSASSRTRRVRRTTSTARAEQAPKEQFTKRPLSSKPSLLSLDLNKLDQELTEEEREEWNAIYASYRSKSLLTGHIMGIDEHSFTVRNRETGQTERRRMLCAVIIQYRVKVLIPETEVWMPGQERPPYVLRNMSGAEIDYTILDVDREGSVAIGSRRMASLARRHFFDATRGGHELGEKLTCRVLSVGPKRCLVECGGRDLSLSQRDLTYTATPDLRERYHPGQTLDCILKEYDRQTGQLWISVKETMANPFFGAVKRHPVGSRRQAVISGKYGGGVFCTLPDETVCLCLYSTRHSDSDFHVGDTVILAIKKFDYDRNLIYGRILSKW